LLVVASGATAACVGERPTLATEQEPTDTTAEVTSSTAPVALAKVAQAKTDSTNVFADATTPTPRGQITADEATSTPGVPVVFLVKDESQGRLEVFLPNPPKGRTGWIDADAVTLSSVSFRIEVSLGRHRLTVFNGSSNVLDEAVAVGVDHPAIGDFYYLKELLQPPDPDGPYGAYVYGLSGYATDLSGFGAGTGVVGIHGTADPDSIGQDTDQGSIALAADVLARLVDDLGLPLGTPVEVIP
jgi:lipoprotein-anchoring transpeptidase ErfK/SrfK